MSVLWTVSDELSAAHATFVVATGAECTDPKLEALLVDFVVQINTRLATESLEMGTFWHEYVRQIAAKRTVAAATKTSLVKAGCSELQLDQTAGAIAKKLADARDVFLRRLPRLVEQLELRGQPLRQQWDAFGAGLMLQVEKKMRRPDAQTPLFPSRLHAEFIQPARGGGGGWNAEEGLVWFEAMLTDADPAVPELLRFAWLMLGLAAERSDQPLSGNTWSLATVPLVLSAGGELDLCSGDPMPIETAMRLWNGGSPAVAAVVLQWWEARETNQWSWTDALNDLDSRLAAF